MQFSIPLERGCVHCRCEASDDTVTPERFYAIRPAQAADGGHGGGAWWINGRVLQSVVLPYAQFVPGYVAARLVELARAGVRVIVMESWPSASVDGRADDVVHGAVSRLKASKGAVFTTTPELLDYIAQRNIQVSRTCPSLMTALRSGMDEQWLLLHNRALQGEASARVTVRESAPHAALLDVSTGQRLRIKYARLGGGLHIDVSWIDVTNTALARLQDSFSHGDAASGLLGPLRIL